MSEIDQQTVDNLDCRIEVAEDRIAEQDAIIEELGAIIEELVGALTERADSCEANITFSDVEWQTGPCECVDCNQNRALIAKATKASSG